MKKVLNYILLTAVLGTFLPYSALAQTTDVGVNITGSVSIDVVTTISANITLDLTTGETTPTYMEIQNNSSVPVNAKITNISTTSEGAPSTFVGADDKDWYNLSKEETSTYVNFNILGEGQNVMPKNILPNTEIDLGTLDLLSSSISTYADTGFNWADENNIRYYEINANFGKNWDEGDKNFTYQITTVYSQADNYTEIYQYPEMKENVNRLDFRIDSAIDLEKNDETKDYIVLVADISGVEGIHYLDYEILDQYIDFSINGEYISTTLLDSIGTMGSTNWEVREYAYPIDALTPGQDFYLKAVIDFGTTTMTYISKATF